MKHGQMKRVRFQSSKRTTAFLRILQQVFPEATTNEDRQGHNSEDDEDHARLG